MARIDPRVKKLTQTVNQEVQDRAIRHALFMERLKTGEVRKTLGFLNDKVFPDVIRTLENRLKLIKRRRGFDRGVWTTQRLRDMVKSIDATIKSGYRLIYKNLAEDMRALAMSEAEFQQGILSEASEHFGVDFRTPAPATLRAIVTQQAIRGRKMRQWFTDLGRGTIERIREQLNIGIAAGETVPQMIRRVRGTARNKFADGVLQTSRHHAENIVRTTTSHVVNQARRLTYEANKDVVKGWKFVATLDARTTEICMAHDGKVYNVDEGPYPPLHHQCRSTTTPVVKSWKELGINLREAPRGTRASMGGQVPDTVTYPEWLKKQPKWVQDEALGKGKAELFRSGRVTVDKFIDDKNRILTLKELRQLEGVA